METLGATFEEVDIPPDLLPEAQKARERIMEILADRSDSLMEKYLAGQEIPLKK